MEPDEETAPNVRLIFEMARQGYDAHKIVEVLFEKGIPTPGEYKASKGKRYHDVSRCHNIWQRSTVLRILGDERYTGKQLQSVLSTQTAQMQMDSEAKSARKKLAQDIVSTDRLTAALADTLIDRVSIYPGNQVEIIWKINDFCMEES